jgi:hypothetical protein
MPRKWPKYSIAWKKARLAGEYFVDSKIKVDLSKQRFWTKSSDYYEKHA